ncbi:hypothetical protein [Psychromonas sp. Urea-02u-13]|uniref:hypothetical protein n=1 Tax=Psychromonas sp. Urea-02u-13 TaxID=2058326 RepID=UPI0012FF559B|nr:hypothetical protein [Psychromonas sp. Urea-02u-13]
MVDIIRFLTNVFSIDVCAYAYAIMSNYYQFVLHANEEALAACSNEDIYTPWSKIYPL